MAVVLKSVASALTAIIEPADTVFVALCPELDLVTEGDTPEAALDDLIEMAVDYAEEYVAEFERHSQSPNRAPHAPYIEALRANPTIEGARNLFAA